MQVHLTAEQEAQLAQLAAKQGTDAEKLVRDAVLGLLEEDARFRAAVRVGIAQADRGQLVEEAEMDARLEQLLRSYDASPLDASCGLGADQRVPQSTPSSLSSAYSPQNV